ncbi:hypothetical protein BH11PSE8_BH11PSE8_42700 [soil metagenome]
MVARLCAFVIWALVAAVAVFWGLRLGARAPETPPNAVAAGDSPALRGDLARLLGAPPIAVAAEEITPEAASRFKLVGVMAPKGTVAASANPPTRGVALIAVDGKPPKAYAVGARLDGDLVLQSVSLRTASIGTAQGASAMKLELPPLTPAATGTLPLMNGQNAGTLPPPVFNPVSPLPTLSPGNHGPAIRPPMQVPQGQMPAMAQPPIGLPINEATPQN